MRARRVVVVGAGLAGLACARRLRAEGLDVLVVEASDGVGGRARTDRLGGFLLDRGFQVLLTAYPEARRSLDYERLGLHEFYPGALVALDGRLHRVADPFRRPFDALASLRTPVASLRDLYSLARVRARARGGTVEQMLARRETSALQALRKAGVSPGLVERFFRPFLGGVFLDPDLATSSRMLDFVLRMFANGYAALPAEGIGALATQLAEPLGDGALLLGEPVERVEAGAVVLASGELVEAPSIVVAVDGSEAARLLAGKVAAPSWRSVACLYFSAEQPPVRGPYLVLDGSGAGPVNNLCVPSEVAPGYAPPGRALVSASVLGKGAGGDTGLEASVRSQLRGWFGPSVDTWEHLRTYRIPQALPALVPPCLEPADRAVRIHRGLYVCGDHRETSSIQGALASGRRAAQALLQEAGR